MSDIEEFIEFVEYSRRPRNAGPRRYLRDYSDPFTEYSVVEFHSRYRFTPHVVKNTLLPMVEEDLRRPTMRGLPFPPEIMILVTLRFYATGSFQVLQRDVECHGRIVSSVVRLCGGGDAARALERRWHLLYLRAIEWQCHLEACLARIDNQSVDLVETVSDSDDEPALKLPRLSRRSSSRSSYTKPQNVKSVAETKDWQSSESDCDSEQDNSMADNRLVPGACTVQMRPTDQTVPGADLLDGPDTHMTLNHNKEKSPYNNPATPPTVIKRKKPVDSSKFNQTDRKSKNYATFYFKHNDTDSDRQMLENDRKSQEESSEEEWTYVGGPTIANEDSTDLMTSSVEIQCDLPLDKPEFPKMDLGYSTPDLLRDQTTRCKDIERLVIQAEELVQQQAQHQIAKMKGLRPLTFDEQGKSVTHAKISRIKEWLNQNSDDKMSMGNEGYDASGEYTTESEMENTMTPEERNLHSSMDMSTSTTVTPTHHAKVQIRTKRSNSNARPWSMSCMSQLSGAGTCLAVMPTTPDGATILHSMSISESALNTLSNPSVTPANSNSKLRGSSTTVKGHVSSTNTMTEACTSCVEANDRQCWLRRKRLKLRRHEGARRERLVKSLSFCGRLSPEWERSERSAASDPSTRKTRFYTRSSSSNDSDKDMMKKQLATIAYLRRSIEQTHISSREPDGAIPEQNENLVCPSFKLGPAGGAVRPRIARSMEHERILLGLSLGDPDRLWDLADKDSDIEKSVTAGTEEHSSFSEQAWDFYQEKYSSEPYSEAPDTDAARRLLEFGDDYRAFLDSQSDCCSSLSAQREPSPGRRRRRATDTLKHRRMSGVVSSTRKPKKSMSSAERKKSLLDSLERSRNNTSLESNEGTRRRKPSESDRKTKRCLETELPSRRRHNSNLTSDEVNSSLEYTEVNNLSNNLDSLGRRRRVGCEGESELELVALSELRRRSAESGDSGSSSPRRARRGDSDSEGEEVRALLRRSNTQLDSTEAALRHDLHHAIDYTEIVARCLENVNLLNAALAGGELCPMLQRDVRAVSARWSALRLAAARRSSARRLRREVASIRATLNEVIEPDDCAPQPHTKNQLNRRMEELKERLFKLLQIKVSMLKLTVSVRRALGGTDADDGGLTAELTGLLAAWDDAHQRTFDELVSLEKVVCAWAEWENGLRELQGALVGDLATLQALKKRGNAPQDSEVAAKIRQLAALLVDKKSGSTCDSLSDSGISDGDSEAAGGRARRLSALRELARRLQAALAPGSPAHRAIAKRMEQTENEVRSLQESCRALVEQSIPDFKADDTKKRIKAVAGSNTGSGDPEYSGRGSWVLRVLRSSLPIQLCLVALLLTAWLVERPRCCHALNSLGQSLTPQLRYVRGPPPV